MIGRAPKGYYCTVDVTVRLKNERLIHGSWTTPMALARAHSKGRSWMVKDMRDRGIRGRSQIVSIRVETIQQALPKSKDWKDV